MTERGQGGAHLGHHTEAVEIAPAVGHAVAGDQHHRVDLAEAVEHGVGAHVGRADAPDRADAHRGQKGHHGLGNVGQVGGDAVAGPHAGFLQVQRQRGHLTPQLGPRQLVLLPLLVAADDGGKARRVRRPHVPEHLLRVVGLRAGKPFGARHHVLLQHRGVRGGGLQVKVVPDALPEGVQLGDRPAPQVVIVLEGQPARVAQPVLVQADLGDEGRGGGLVHGVEGSSGVRLAHRECYAPATGVCTDVQDFCTPVQSRHGPP